MSFSSYNIEIPKKFQESVKQFCKTGDSQQERKDPEYVPFERQVDFWFMAFLIAVNKELEPEYDTDTYNATAAHILSGDPFREDFIRLAILGITKDVSRLANERELFNYCLGLANAGMPHLIQILSDPDDKPLWALLTYLEKASKMR